MRFEIGLWAGSEAYVLRTTAEPRPRRLALVGQWLIDVLIGILAALPFGIPLLVEQNALKHHDSQLFDVWQFDSMPDNHGGLRAWGAGQADLDAFRVEVLARNQIVLQYVRKNGRDATVPDWPRLGYVNARLLSSDVVPVGDTDLPRSALGWSCEFMGSLAIIAVLRRRLALIWSPGAAWRMPSRESWKIAAFVALVTIAIDIAANRFFGRSDMPPTSAQRVIGQLSGWPLLMAWATVAVAGPAMEETLFRGCFLGRFRKHGYCASGIVFSAVAFAVAHKVPLLMPRYFCNGLILAWLSHRTESLWPAFAVHVAWNIVAAQAATFV
ncbi:MAG TPA: CPBP family intramembrane glutamic endopeptidase [Terriglobales bacterium]|nr:CPBP family intramembrane glutamic endopeptidase [Terriglobales bacterium]